MSSSCSLRARHRLGHDATNTTQQGRWPAHNHAMTSLAATVFDMPPYANYGRYDAISGVFRKGLVGLKHALHDLDQLIDKLR